MRLEFAFRARVLGLGIAFRASASGLGITFRVWNGAWGADVNRRSTSLQLTVCLRQQPSLQRLVEPSQ